MKLRLNSTRSKLILMGIVLGCAIGGTIWQITSHAATPALSVETESSTLSGGASVVDSTGASGGEAIKFGTATASSDTRGPIRFANLAAARAALHAPADANYVMWNPSWPVNRDLEDVFATELGPNDILVLPERPQPYIIDSSEGFRATGVKSITGQNGKQLPVISTYHGKRNARTWFAMARAQRGVLGLGPGAVIQMSQSSWTQERQIENKGHKMADGTISPGRFYTGTDGKVKTELIGAAEKMMEAASRDPYFGNFTMQGHDLGGVAYNGIGMTGDYDIAEHLNLTGAWRGFEAIPNGETGAIGVNRAKYFISDNIVGTRDSTGKRVGTSPVMINSSPGGTIQNMDIMETVAGMLTIWNSSGTHTLNNVKVGFNWNSAAINLEKTQPGFHLVWNGGYDWSDYKGNGGIASKPSDQATKGGMHLSMFADGTSAQVTIHGVSFDKGLAAGSVNIQSFGSTVQRASDIKAYDANNNVIPVKLYNGSP